MRSEHGIALITILVMVALATILAATIAKHQRHTAEHTAYLIRQNQTLLYAKSAEAFFSQLLIDDAKNAGESDHLQETWAKPMPAFPVQDGLISGRLEDESGKFNLNGLLKPDGTVNEAAKLWFERLLMRVGLNAQLVDAVIDWQDADEEVSGPMGAEAAAYQSSAQAYLTPNTAFHHVEELKLVRGFEGSNYQLIAPYVSALPTHELKVNINTASDVLLASLGINLDIGAIQALRSQRAANLEYFSEPNMLWQFEPFKQVTPEQQATVNEFLDVKSHYFKAKIEVLLNDRKRQFSSNLMRKAQNVYSTSRSIAPF